MVRSFWNAISFLALVNVLALLIVIAWLWQSGRLTRERVEDIRTMLSTTTLQAHETAVRLATEAEAERLKQEQEELRTYPPSDSEAQVRQIALLHQQEQQARQRLQDEQRMLSSQLSQATSRMEADTKALESRESALRQDAQDEFERKSEAQFQQAVKQFEQIPPKQAKKMIEQLVAERRIDQAVEYLNAMNPRAASKVMREFKTDSDIVLATELLERLRRRGLPSSGDSAPSQSAVTPDLTNAAAGPATNSG